MVKILSQSLTIEEFLQLSETKPASEFIRGEILQKPMPQGKHSLIQGELVTNINLVAKPDKIAIAFPELRCRIDDRVIVPDVVVLPYGKIPRDENGDIANIINGTPDWMIEILSPNQNTILVTEKILHCLNNGCTLAWLIDPQSKKILVFQPNQQPIFLQNPTDIIPSPNFLPNYQLTVETLFGWLNF